MALEPGLQRIMRLAWFHVPSINTSWVIARCEVGFMEVEDEDEEEEDEGEEQEEEEEEESLRNDSMGSDPLPGYNSKAESDSDITSMMPCRVLNRTKVHETVQHWNISAWPRIVHCHLLWSNTAQSKSTQPNHTLHHNII